MDWDLVFELRCRSKRGEHLAPGEQRLVERAYREDPVKYAGLEADVWGATVPFGSTVRHPRSKVK